jgi:hypothetical protein
MTIKEEWFGGNQAALDIYIHIIRLIEVWDNLIDKDKPVSESEINDAFLVCLFHLPLNPVYKHLQDHIAPMWLTVVNSYEAANSFERLGDEHSLELSHILRYTLCNIIGYIMTYCLGREKAKDAIPLMWKKIVRERFSEYSIEHLKAGIENV